MTILCITTTGIPGIRQCTTLGEHKVTCHDHPGWADRPGTCRGCLPRHADRGHLCEWCFELVAAEYAEWDDFRALLAAADGRTASPDNGGISGSSPEGFTNLSLAFLAVDEVVRHLGSFYARPDDARSLDLWVSTPAGARDAIQFAHAAASARRSLQVEERQPVIVRERCPNCERVTVRGHVTREERNRTIVECDHCGHQLAVVRREFEHWSGSPACEHDGHLDCAELSCACDCHHLGRGRPGIRAVWDGDEHAFDPSIRAQWIVTSPTTIARTGEEARAA